MCPDKNVISLYFDEELPSPWKEKMEAHFETCPDCRTTLAGYRRLGDCIDDLPDEKIQTAQDRVWQKLNADLDFSGKSGSMYMSRWEQFTNNSFWKKNVTLPLPALAAAAAAVFILFFAFLGIRNDLRPHSQQPMAILSDSIQVSGDSQGAFLPVQDMTGVIGYLSRQSSGDFMVIRLPESKRFYRTGQPALINAADYSRRTDNLRRNAFR